jgi:AcrR family transcriptional regulator
MAYRPTEKTLARKAELRQRLLAASLELVSTGGFGALTIAAVASQAGMATGAVYKHFESKAHLCVEVFRMATEKEVAVVREATLGPEAPDARLRHAVGASLPSAHCAIRAWLSPLIAEPVDALVDAQRLRYRQAYAQVFEQLVLEGIASGAFEPQPASVSAAALVGVIAESLVGPLSWPASDTPPTPTSELVDAIQAFCLRAVSRRLTP